jgi:hypothetical protein
MEPSVISSLDIPCWAMAWVPVTANAAKAMVAKESLKVIKVS